MSPRLCRVFGFTTWFRVADAGMTEHEPLARASAFLVQRSGRTDAAAPNWHVLASQHVTHPWRYPHYFPAAADTFLPHVNESHVIYTLDVRSEDGDVIHSMPLRSVAHGHPARDLSVCAFESAGMEGEWLRALRERDLESSVLRLRSGADGRVRPGEKLGIFGHHVEARQDASGNDTSPLRPRSSYGHFIDRSTVQAFAYAQPLLVMGMCGGPVMTENEEVVGLLEGIVPSPAQDDARDDFQRRVRQQLAGAAVFVESDEIQAFLHAVEQLPLR